MKTIIYSHGWNLIRYGFDYRNALDNWARHADQISIAINTSTDGTYEAVEAYAKQQGYPVHLTATSFDFATDPFAYGKVVNAALQACQGDLYIQQDMDERIRFGKGFPEWALHCMSGQRIKAFFVPTIDLYGDVNQYLRCAAKWYVHLPGLYRGAVNFGLKENSRPDYNKTSTDELIDEHGNLVPTERLWYGNESMLKGYMTSGLPLVYHLGYVNLTDRIERAAWWGPFWTMATGGDPNGHSVTMDELLKRETKPHGLPLWEPQPLRGFRKNGVVLDDALEIPKP